MKKTLTLVLLLLSGFLISAQTLVNQYVQDTAPYPSSVYSYIKFLPDGVGGTVLLEDIEASNQLSAVIVVHEDSTGTTTGQSEEFTFGSGGTFSSSMYVKDPYIYVTAFSLDSTLTQSHFCTTLKLDMITLDTIWSVTDVLDSGGVEQIPVAVTADASGNVYMGASVWTPNGYKIELLKYSASGTNTWRYNFDTIGLNSIPVALSISGIDVTVAGFRYNGSGYSDYLTLAVNRTGGTLDDKNIIPNGTGMISHPVGICSGFSSINPPLSISSGYSYVAGTSTVAGNASVFKVVKYDSAFNQLFVSTWGDSTVTNTAVAMCADNSLNVVENNLLVTGASPNSSGGTDMVTVSFRTDGSVAWSRRISAANAANTLTGVAITNDGNGNTFVTGASYDGTDTSVVTASLDTSGIVEWLKTYALSGTNVIPYTISTNGTSILVGAKNTSGDTIYITLEYDTYTKTNTINATPGGGQYEADQLIIRFDPSAVNQDAVNNIGTDFAAPSYWLTATADSALQANVPFDLSTCTMERIYRGLKATYKYSTARNGDQVLIPNLWAAFVLHYPDQGKSEEVMISQQINTLFPMVVHTGLNYVGQFLGGCNNTVSDTFVRISDPYFSPGYLSGYTGQQNLWGSTQDTSYYCDPFYHINIDSAWQLETGKSFIKVGMYDSGLDGLNQDFVPNLNDPLGTNTGTKVYGWDFYSNSSMNASNWSDPGYPHGTWTSGIVGAIRNNDIGIAGIAGGNWSATDTNNFGVTLYAMKILEDGDALLTMPVSDLCNALVQGSSFVSDSAYGFGLHVINCSWGMITDSNAAALSPPPPPALNDSALSELELAFKNVYRNQTAIVAAAGNAQDEYLYPANFYGDWVICVGGADDTGARYNCNCGAATTTYSASYAGPSVDLIAPSISTPPNYYITSTTVRQSGGVGSTNYGEFTNTFNPTGTGDVGGTSLAAPHATGTVALLMSYLDSIAPSYQNLSPEDAQQLLTLTTINRPPGGRNDSVGYGDLNAGGALQAVNKGCKELVHLGRTGNNPVAALVKPYVPITLTEQYTNPLTGITYNSSTPYLCWVYKESTTMSQHLDSNFVVTNSWGRPSSTSLILMYDSTTQTLQPFEHLYIDSISNSSATVSGYYYVVYSVADSSFLGYWGADSALTVGQDSFRFDYTVLLNNPTVNCHPIDTTTTTRIKNITNNIGVSFYPNPVGDAALLQIFTSTNTNVSIDLVDMTGRDLESIYSGSLAEGSTSFNIDTKPLSSGIYTIVIHSGEGTKTIKFTKP